MSFLVEGCNAVDGHFYFIASVSGIRHGMQDTDIRAYAANDQCLRIQFLQLPLEDGIIEAAEVLLVDHLCLVPGKLGDEFSLRGSLNAVRRKQLELGVICGMVVANMEYRCALP